MARLHRPNDPTLPYFAYDAFKPKQVAFPVIEHFIDYIEPYEFELNGYELRHRNGIPMVVEENANIPIKGYLIYFNNNVVSGYNNKPRSDAYDFICRTKPRSLFKWRQISGEDCDFNITLAQDRDCGVPYNIYGNRSNYSGTNDPTFFELLDYIKNNIDSMRIHRNYESLYQLEMNYMLLWSSIDKYLFLCNGGWDQRKNVEEWSKWEEFKSGFESVSRVDKVDSTNSNATFYLNPNNSTSSAKYYYQLRCNIVHSGKKENADVSFIKDSLEELLSIFRQVLHTSFNGGRYQEYDLAYW